MPKKRKAKESKRLALQPKKRKWSILETNENSTDRLERLLWESVDRRKKEQKNDK